MHCYYFLNGFFFVMSGAKPVPIIFHGYVANDPLNALGGYIGEINDKYGCAALTDIYCDDTVLRFTKRYHHRTDTIQFELTRQPDDTWIGHYHGSETGNNWVRCMVTRCPESMAEFLWRGGG